ncbi:hypothetical protein VOLCADRAFT_80369 [Volvox carteri f. nagariensis]|uniref:Cytochrome b5 heme-binding domain-containing protein n=1 Tax=Volvox carteri f. nagariensis TaxID=3068 RepID=D8TQW2_VOLCA|nr:uncharacterized protein VOLCADRAFT_80369 [Volvox carteri f. nagariensis]EFJ50101.1 hypothetical protein VOLCADRAFT_80369 [Volvox carteri f. nagariensis]|eukprot:XP_002948721.1 hypothetical protein VOLCADRAFT_80369 [Volvox carteri f. nagariensis]
MELTQILIIAAVGIALVASIILRQTRSYVKQLEQLDPKKKQPREFGIYTLEQVAKHNKRDDAWIIVQHKETKEYRVYDITDYVDEHPGGESILNNIGGDATEGFHGPQHPITTYVLVEEYCIGKLAEGEMPSPPGEPGATGGQKP